MPPTSHPIRIGTAGWSIPRLSAAHFPGSGSHLERYSRVLSCTEINSSFYRLPRSSTWSRWAASVPDDFRFSVKAPKDITHTGLTASAEQLQQFIAAAQTLGDKLGPILFQLPPSFAFDARIARAFFALFRSLYSGATALEPRHATWFTPEADALLKSFHIARVAADPARVPAAAVPLASPQLAYYRLHGSPRTYYSSYTPEFLAQLTTDIRAHGQNSQEVWVIFDNTASGAAAANALDLSRLLML